MLDRREPAQADQSYVVLNSNLQILRYVFCKLYAEVQLKKKCTERSKDVWFHSPPNGIKKEDSEPFLDLPLVTRED